MVLFAGMGGACQGLEEAGFPVHIAVNHDAVAIAAHRALNPHTKHLHADIYEVCPLDATDGREVNILWMSPDCRDHSVAKGGAPRSPRVRSMPWQGCRWVGKLRKRGRGPKVVYLENVREIRGWGPLIAKRCPKTGRVLKRVEVPHPKKPGKTKEIAVAAEKGERVPVQQQFLVRDPKRLGKTYRRWVRHMQGLGVRYEDRDLNCAEHGVPTGRKRLFGVGVFNDEHPIMWMPKTHAPRGSDLVLSGQRLPYRMAAEIINWRLPLPSIFDRSKELAPATRQRIAVGMKRFVIEAERPFLIYLTHHGERPEIDPVQPFPTFTGAHRGEVALIGPTVVPTTHTGTRVNDGTKPLGVLTAGVKGGEFAVMGVEVRPSGQDWRYDQREALSTHTDKDIATTVAAHLTKFQENSVGQTPRAPIDTVMAGAPRFGVVGAFLEEHRTGSVGQPAEAPLAAQTQTEHHALVGAWMVQHNTGVTGHAMEESLSTMTTVGTQQQVAAAYLTELRGTSRDGQPVTDPAGTMCTGGGRGGGHDAVTAAFLTEYYSVGGQHQECGAPLNTLTTNDRFGITGAELAPQLSPEKLARARLVADFLREHGVWDEREFVTVGPWLVVDIGMRMLTPAEAAAAHELTMPEEIEIDGVRRPLTKTEAMRLVGNSVPKRMARLLAEANAVHTLYAPSRQLQAAE
ncbi:DNA cytosine methyltransferase [Azospirillum sp.]|uniref:DNA cytosine methyltransferase n=1 Tax=Azospirillum sp. TaxID=34012 RepID=UPI003D717B97